MSKPRAVLVTGSSTGIGFEIANYLAENGFHIFAGVRKESDFERLNHAGIDPIILDVTDVDNIESAYRLISSKKIPLYAIVNNAGIGSLGFLSSFTEEDMKQIFEVNTFGPWRLVKRFLDLIVENQGRIINIGSQGGVIGGKKLFGPYMMTKHALEVYTDSLREECSSFGVKVSIVEPGGIKSEIGNNAMEGQLRRFEYTPEPFTKEAQMILEFLKQPPQEFDVTKPESENNRKASNPRIVSEVVLDALLNENPKDRYLVGTHWEGMRAINHLTTLLLQVNDNPKHNFPLEQLIDILKQQHSNYKNKLSNSEH